MVPCEYTLLKVCVSSEGIGEDPLEHISLVVSTCHTRIHATKLFMFSCLSSLRTLRSKKQQSSSAGLSLSLSQAATPRKTLSFSAVSTPVNSSSSSVVQESNTASDASLLTSIMDQSHLRQRTVTTTTTSTSVDGHWGQLLKI